MQPQYIFETSWEVCNRVGGIYAVLSTRAASMQNEHKDKVIFFGPDFGDHSNLTFKESKTLLKGWRPKGVRVGRWQVPGKPIAVLLRWDELWAEKDQIFGHMWEKFGIQSHAAYGDYDESCLFAYAVGQVAESLYKHLDMPTTVMHCNEWQTAFTILYLREHCPAIGTLFTTHATSIGRSIAGNYKPLYDCFDAFQGDQMAQELNMVSKHSAEKKAAHLCDCFTTVSDLTARECKQLLDKPVDIVTPNGFEQGFVPQDKEFDAARKRARNTLISLARAKGIDANATDMLIGTAGRYEWKNKGIDVFLEAMTRLGEAPASTPYTLHPTPSLETVAKVIGLTKDRVNFVSELWEQVNFFFVAPTEYDEKSLKKRWKEDSPKHMTEMLALLEAHEDWSAEGLDNLIMPWIAEKEYGVGIVMNAFRICLVGAARGPHIWNITDVLGKEETLKRVRTALEKLG